MSSSLIIGGSGGLGRAIAQVSADRGDSVIVTSRDQTRADKAAAEIGPTARGAGADLTRPETLADALADVGEIDHLVITALHQARNSIDTFSVADAVKSATAKLVGYTEAVRVMRDRFRPGASVVLFGGSAKDRPYPGSTLVSAANGAVSSLIRSLAMEIAPVRVNALHPGVVADSPVWENVPETRTAPLTLSGRAINMTDITDAADFLLRNPAVNALDLFIDGGLRLMDRPTRR